MNRLGLVAVCASVTWCALAKGADWHVPGNWEVRVSEKGAVQEWTGKTWCGHIQGMCATSNALYFAFHNQIVKTDWYGRLIKRAENLVKHQGDICWWNGHLYTIVCHLKGPEGRIQMFDEDLNLVKERIFTRPVGAGGDGITCLDGVLYIGLSTVALPGEEKLVRHCARYRKFDATTLEDIGDTFVVDHHAPLYSTGQQNITTDGTYLYVASDVPDEGGYNFFKFDKDFNVLGKWSFGWFQGVDVVPGGKDGAVRFAYCSTPNWMRPREKPGLSVHALVLFADIKGDKVTDITRHCVFKNPIRR